MRVMLVDPNVGYGPLPNLGLAYLIASIDNSHSVSFVDLTFEWKNYMVYFEKRLREDKPDIIGFSVSSFSFPLGLTLACLTRKLFPHLHIVFGGVHPTISPEEVIGHPCIDSVCIGEGERSFLEFLDTLETGKEPFVDGFWFKDKKGKIVRNTLRPFELNLDDLPFPNWDYWDIEKYMGVNSVYTGVGGLMHITSRGCRYSCNFCSVHRIRASVPGTYYRVRSAENIIEEIKRNIKKYWGIGFRGIDFFDGLFGADWEQFEQFCSLYKQEGLHKILPWACMTRADVVTEQWAQLASQTGCMKFNFGVETADENVRNVFYKKQLSNERIEWTIKLIEKYDIHYLFLMMIGCPADSKETIKKNIDFIKRHSPIEVRMPFCQPYPGTDYSKAIGISIDETDKDFNFLKGDDLCRTGTTSLSVKELNRIIWFFRLWWIGQWVITDFKKVGFRFILDLMKYIFNIGDIKKIPLRHPYTYKVVKARTHLQYYFDEWKKRHGIKIER
ncbi:MAG: B12-binding domain-containing radical SAM protein [Candidatus Omnitrophica bacterium]|nr:B12-binding domain-containing radical SAM protein [Candidatus Omnitrophota bacterium]